MSGLHEHGALMERFAVAKPDYIKHADHQGELSAKVLHDRQSGEKSGSTESMIKTSAAASVSAKNDESAKAERKAKQQARDALFIELLRNGDLDTHLSENIFGGRNDVEIAEIVATIEAETGSSLEDYAREILGDELPQRRAGEADADYNRRILTVVADEILNDDLTIKAGYENDPVARIIKGDAEYREALHFVQATNASTSVGRDIKAEEPGVRSHASQSITNSDVAGNGLDNAELAGVSRDVQDQAGDTTLAELAQNDLGFGALSLASATFGSNFQTAAAEPIDEANIPANGAKPIITI